MTLREFLGMISGAAILAVAAVAVFKLVTPAKFSINPLAPAVIYREGGCTISRLYDRGEYHYWAECQDGAVHASEVIDESGVVVTQYGGGV